MSSGIARDGVGTQRLFVLPSAPSHPLSAPDPHLMLKLMDAENERLSAEQPDEDEDED